MPTLALIRTVAGLSAADETTRKAMDKIPLGTVITRKYTTPRNGAHHRLRFAWVNDAYQDIEHLNLFGSSEKLRAYLTLQTTHIDTIISPVTGEVWHRPKSWAYPPDGPGEEEFREVMNQIGNHFFDVLVPCFAERGQWTSDYTEQFCLRHFI